MISLTLQSFKIDTLVQGEHLPFIRQIDNCRYLYLGPHVAIDINFVIQAYMWDCAWGVPCCCMLSISHAQSMVRSTEASRGVLCDSTAFLLISQILNDCMVVPMLSARSRYNFTEWNSFKKSLTWFDWFWKKSYNETKTTTELSKKNIPQYQQNRLTSWIMIHIVLTFPHWQTVPSRGLVSVTSVVSVYLFISTLHLVLFVAYMLLFFANWLFYSYIQLFSCKSV